MAENEYIYAVTKVHIRENALLDRAAYEQLLTAPDYEGALAVLAEKGWDTQDPEAGAVLNAQENQLWDFLAELVEDLTPFGIFLLQNDYHNLKAAIKQAATGSSADPIFVPRGTVPLAEIRRAAEAHDFSALPAGMDAAGEAAWEVMHTSGDGRQCDMVLDTAALAAVWVAGKASSCDLMRRYAELTVAAADIKTAVRCAKLGKPAAFVRGAMVACDTLSADRLAMAAAQGTEEVCAYLADTDYAEGVAPLRKSLAAFECWCDDHLMQAVRQEKNQPTGLGPLAAYLLARQSEVKSVRMILSGQASHLPMGEVRERLREPYV